MTSLAFVLSIALAAEVVPPQVLDDRLQVQLVAAEPDVVTPTGLAVDARGRVLVIESHTHFRPDGYKGPEHDRILLLEDFDPATGKARKISVFFEGTKYTMNLAVYHDGSIYVATRSEIFRLRDTDDDGKADERTRICHLETDGNYPHNGLSGFAFHFAGNVYFGFGENLGADYKLIGSDGVTLAGGGEGGNIYTCDPAGGKLRRVATGFWNPFHLCFDAFGRLFAVDNDPDSRPPCRLLHIVEGGDYGYRFRNGRKGVHPFTAWNGELPGTLPMVAGTGEAPCAVLAYESDNLPEEYRGDLLVTSWGDHRLERYRLRPRGASFGAEMTPVLRGDQNFRPVGLALAPDGSLYMSDWVDKSYNLHGKGRVWRISAKNPPAASRPDDPIAALSSPHGPWREAAARKLSEAEKVRVASSSADVRARAIAARATTFGQGRQEGWLGVMAVHAPEDFKYVMSIVRERMRGKPTSELTPRLIELMQKTEHSEIRLMASQCGFPMPSAAKDLDSEDPFLQHSAVKTVVNLLKSDADKLADFERQFVQPLFENPPRIHPPWLSSDNRVSLGMAIAFRRFTPQHFEQSMSSVMLASADPRVQLIGLQWIAESKLQERKEDVEKCVQNAGSRQVLEAALATLEILDRGGSTNPKDERAGEGYIAKILENPESSAALQRFAVRTLPADHPALSEALLKRLLVADDPALRLEALRTIRDRRDAERWPQLREIAASSDMSVQERCEAILGLSPGNRDDRKLLLELAASDKAEVSDEALRALRGFDLTASEKTQLTELAAKLTGPHQELAQRVLDRNPRKRERPAGDDAAAWGALAAGEGNAAAGERIFYHARVGACYRCHEFVGRGYQVGPNLTGIGRTMTPERLAQSILDPSREIAPMFTNWSILTTDGDVKTGVHVGDEVDGRMKFADKTGRIFHVHPNDIERRQPSQQSVMPAGYLDELTPQELRDLMAFLTSGEK
jgi:putative membrane-bound dehydrogenase-like protein